MERFTELFVEATKRKLVGTRLAVGLPDGDAVIDVEMTEAESADGITTAFTEMPDADLAAALEAEVKSLVLEPGSEGIREGSLQLGGVDIRVVVTVTLPTPTNDEEAQTEPTEDTPAEETLTEDTEAEPVNTDEADAEVTGDLFAGLEEQK